MSITTVGLDADDTLWHNETIFRLTHDRFVALLADHAEPATLEVRLAETEQRNLRLYGYGVKGFTLSMIETAMELTGGEAPASVVREILA
ncbi:MAG: HAD family hydrolase, partial [Brevundimonas sp.]